MGPLKTPGIVNNTNRVMDPDTPIWLLLVHPGSETEPAVEGWLRQMPLKLMLLKASSPEKCADLLSTHSFDLLIALCGEEGSPCISIAEYTLRHFSYLPCIFITGKNDQLFEQVVQRSGMNDHLSEKGCTALQLERSIRSTLNRSRILRSLRESADIIAHEIKNPLTNIRLSVHELRELLHAEEKNKSAEDFLSIIERNERRINRLIEDLLNATRFDTFRMKRLQLHEPLEEALILADDRIKLKGILLEKNADQHLALKGDKEKLVIAILNILVNAVEAVEERKGQIQVEAFTSGKEHCLTITDNGQGIPQENMIRLFEPFFSSKKRGTGLGLASAYNIIAGHGGSIRVTSKAGEGSTFIILLPAARA